MNKGNTVLQSLTSHISRYEFQKSVNLFDGDKKVRTLTTRNLFMALRYSLANRDSQIFEAVLSLCQLPHQVFLSNGCVHENTTLQDYEYEKDDILVFDRGYINYKSFHRLNLAGSTFVTRLKRNATITRAITNPQPHDSPVLEDAVGTFAGKKACQDYPGTIRAIIYRDPETRKIYRFLTKNLDLSAQSIADIYKQRWQIELFFKWIKQNLKIKTFFGTSRNAVWSQIYVALSIHLLIWLTKVFQGIEVSLQRIMQVLKVTALERRPIHELFSLPDPDPPPDSLPLFEGSL